MYVLLFQVRPVFPKKNRLKSKLCTSNQTEQNWKKYIGVQRTVDKQVFFRDSLYCSTYFEIRNPVPRQSTSFSYTFSCHFEAFIYVFTHKIRERHKEKYFVIPSRDIHIECSKKFKWNSYFYVSGQSRPFLGSTKIALKFKYEISIG